jgi:hypothetical protein
LSERSVRRLAARFGNFDYLLLTLQTAAIDSPRLMSVA